MVLRALVALATLATLVHASYNAIAHPRKDLCDAIRPTVHVTVKITVDPDDGHTIAKNVYTEGAKPSGRPTYIESSTPDTFDRTSGHDHDGHGGHEWDYRQRMKSDLAYGADNGYNHYPNAASSTHTTASRKMGEAAKPNTALSTSSLYSNNGYESRPGPNTGLEWDDNISSAQSTLRRLDQSRSADETWTKVAVATSAGLSHSFNFTNSSAMSSTVATSSFSQSPHSSMSISSEWLARSASRSPVPHMSSESKLPPVSAVSLNSHPSASRSSDLSSKLSFSSQPSGSSHPSDSRLGVSSHAIPSNSAVTSFTSPHFTSSAISSISSSIPAVCVPDEQATCLTAADCCNPDPNTRCVVDRCLPCTPQTNRVADPGFETGIDPWVVNFIGEPAIQAGPEASIAAQEGDFHFSAIYGGQIYADSRGLTLTQVVSVPDNTRVSCRAFAMQSRADAVPSSFSLTLDGVPCGDPLILLGNQPYTQFGGDLTVTGDSHAVVVTLDASFSLSEEQILLFLDRVEVLPIDGGLTTRPICPVLT